MPSGNLCEIFIFTVGVKNLEKSLLDFVLDNVDEWVWMQDHQHVMYLFNHDFEWWKSYMIQAPPPYNRLNYSIGCFSSVTAEKIQKDICRIYADLFLQLEEDYGTLINFSINGSNNDDIILK